MTARETLLPEQVGGAPSDVTEAAVIQAGKAYLRAELSRGDIRIRMSVFDLEYETSGVWSIPVGQVPGAVEPEDSACGRIIS